MNTPDTIILCLLTGVICFLLGRFVRTVEEGGKQPVARKRMQRPLPEICERDKDPEVVSQNKAVFDKLEEVRAASEGRPFIVQGRLVKNLMLNVTGGMEYSGSGEILPTHCFQWHAHVLTEYGDFVNDIIPSDVWDVKPEDIRAAPEWVMWLPEMAETYRVLEAYLRPLFNVESLNLEYGVYPELVEGERRHYVLIKQYEDTSWIDFGWKGPYIVADGNSVLGMIPQSSRTIDLMAYWQSNIDRMIYRASRPDGYYPLAAVIFEYLDRWSALFRELAKKADEEPDPSLFIEDKLPQWFKDYRTNKDLHFTW